MNPGTRPPGRSLTVLALIVALTYPSGMAWLYFVQMSGTGQGSVFQQASFACAKVFQFALPLLFVALVVHRWPTPCWPDTSNLLLGIGFGLVVAVAMGAVYWGWLRGSPSLGDAPARFLNKMREFGVASPVTFLMVGVFYTLVHSFLEEYYWRWFVFGQLRTLLPLGSAILLSSLGFMAHHVLILHTYLPDRFWTVVLPASLAVAIGGAVWAWLYDSSRSLLSPWISHGLIDAALFLIGWDLVR